MGGGYYDREVIAPANEYLAGNSVVGSQKGLYEGLDPKNLVEEESQVICHSQNPIVFALDVTGSMAEWPRIIYDKLPMFFGQIKLQGYLSDPAISFCAIGDATCDEAPLQVSNFGQGKQIDEIVQKLYLEGHGGANQHQSYELAAYFYNHHVKLVDNKLAFFFVTGDEGYFEEPLSEEYLKVLHVEPTEVIIPVKEEWAALGAKYNVFHIKKQYPVGAVENEIYKQWVETLGKQRVIQLENPMAFVDVVLGLIALTSGRRGLKDYAVDMKERGQTKQRIDEVVKALELYAAALDTGLTKPVIFGRQEPHLTKTQ